MNKKFMNYKFSSKKMKKNNKNFRIYYLKIKKK